MVDNSKTLQLTLQVKDDGSVVVDTVKGKIDQLNQSTISGGASVIDSLNKVKTSWLAVAGGATAAYMTIKKFADAASEAEQIESRMAFQIGQVGYKFDEIKPFVDDFADSILKTTRFSDEMARQGLGQMMQYTTDVGQAMQATKIAMDMTTQTGMGLESTTRAVGMAMNGNVEMLGRWIPELRDLDAKLGSAATNAEKAEYAFKIFNEKFGSASQKDLDTYAGKLERAKNQFGELVEKAGGLALPVLSKSMEGWNFIFEGLTGTGRFESYEDMLKRMRALNEAALKAEKQARLNAIEKANKEEMDLLIKTQNETVAVEQEFSKKVFQLNQNQFGLMEIARREDLAKFKGTNADRWAVVKYYEDLENKLRQDRQAKELDAVQSLTTMWKSYYDERISRENEVISLIKQSGVETTIGAKFEFAGVEEQFRKISEQAGRNPLITEEELKKLKAVYIQKLQGILPYQGGEWEEFTEPTGREMGPGGPRTTYGTDWRFKQGVMSEEQRRVEAMREESIRRIEGMGAGVTGARPGDIVSMILFKASSKHGKVSL